MRLIAAAVAVVACWLAPLPSLAHDTACGGLAPQVTSCSTGTHTGGSTTHGVTAGAGYSGTLASMLKHATGTRTFRCSIVGGVAIECLGSGPFAPAGEPYAHSCTSVLAESPGGVGLWSCYVRDA